MARIALSLVVFASVISVAACSAEDNGDSGPAANGGSGSGSNAGTGNTTAGTTGVAGTGTTNGGNTSTPSGGSGGGGGGSAFTCAGTALAAPEITDFTTMGAMNSWGTPPGLSGGLFAYPAAAMTIDASAGAMSVSGNVADYAGFGVWFAACSDASAFDGISFDISGDVGPSAKISVSLQTHSDFPIDTVGMKGGCSFSSELAKYTECVTPVVTKDVPAGGGTVTVAWADFAGGKPVAAADPSEIVGIQWSFAWAGATDTAYPADVTLDNVKFLGESSGEGGAPGTGGAGPSEGGAGPSEGGASSGEGGAGGA